MCVPDRFCHLASVSMLLSGPGIMAGELSEFSKQEAHMRQEYVQGICHRGHSFNKEVTVSRPRKNKSRCRSMGRRRAAGIMGKLVGELSPLSELLSFPIWTGRGGKEHFKLKKLCKQCRKM